MHQETSGLARHSVDKPHTGAWANSEPGGYQGEYIRRDVVQSVVAELTAGSSCGVLLVGSPGVGKSFIAQRVLEQLDSQYFVVHVRGSASCSAMNFGALSVLLNELDSASIQQPLMMLRGLTHLLHKMAQGRGIIIFVDNAHELDEMSALTIAQLSVGGHVRLLAACEEMPDAAGDIMSLWKDDLLRRVDILPFDFKDTASILQLKYGGRFSFSAARALWVASGGNGLFVKVLTEEQMVQGLVISHDGAWLLRGTPVVITGEIRGIIKARLSRLSPGQRDIVQLLALGGTIPLQRLMQVAKPEDIDALQESSDIDISSDHPAVVKIADPVSSAIIASIVPPGRSAELRRRLNAVLGDHEDNSQCLKEVSWSLDCGECITSEKALEAARAANKASDPYAALRFLRQLRTSKDHPSAAIESAWAHLSLNQASSVLVILKDLDETALDVPFQEWIALQVSMSELDRRSRSTTVNARLRLAEVESKLASQPAARTLDFAAVSQSVRVSMAELAAFDGRFKEVDHLLENADRADLQTETGLVAAGLLCASMAISGDMSRAMRLSDEIASAAYNQTITDRVLREIRGLWIQLLLVGGEYKQCDVYLHSLSQSREPLSRLGGMFEIAPGLLQLHRGQIDDALCSLEVGAHQLLAHDPDGLAGLAFAACSFAAALKGDERRTEAFLAKIGTVPSGASWITNRLTRYYELCARAEGGINNAIVERLLAEAEHDFASSATGPALQFLSVAARTGNMQLGPRLKAFSGQASGSFAALCTSMGEAFITSDSEMMLAASRDSDAAGNAIFARDAARKAVLCAEESGNRILLRTAQRAQQSLEDRFSGSTSDHQLLATSGLTAREREVAKAAAAGISNRRIAEQMHVSVRTIEGHLYQVYAKLHVTSRAELKDAVAPPAGQTAVGSEKLQRRLS